MGEVQTVLPMMTEQGTELFPALEVFKTQMDKVLRNPV